ncbi:F-box/LRR-repeat protein At3g48880-like [Pistacia vera]|uniref:F-box/LRR-repeat protein At3g48880-like n=1 Tax=Pistacia vera TaxID=55513 RepID=UPI001263A782|nr:F-box/LRR-repeat protein At3g48880-like [Pistacia vera]
MKEGASAVRRWKDLDTDILVKIFLCFDVFQSTSGIDHVCNSWCSACCDPLLWKTLDLSMLRSTFIKIPLEPYVYVDECSDKTLICLLKISLSLSWGQIRTLIFHFNLYVGDEQFTYIAKRCPQLRCLVMPAWNRIKKDVICKAIHTWRSLISLTMPSIVNPPYLIEEIALNCKNFSELKVMGPFDVLFAFTIAKFLPNLKILSLRCSVIVKDALMLMLDDLANLEVLNISYCLLIEGPLLPPLMTKKIIKKLDKIILEKAAQLCEFLICTEHSCIMCQRTRSDEGFMRWYKYEEGLWKMDEARSLAL